MKDWKEVAKKYGCDQVCPVVIEPLNAKDYRRIQEHLEEQERKSIPCSSIPVILNNLERPSLDCRICVDDYGSLVGYIEEEVFYPLGYDYVVYTKDLDKMQWVPDCPSWPSFDFNRNNIG